MKNLESENKILKKKLSIAQAWMKREILSNLNGINVSKVNFETSKSKKSFFSENVEEIVYNQVYNFFGEELFMYFSKDILENIISGEILFFALNQNKAVDGLGIIISYNKSFDLFVEENITKLFRKYFNSKKYKFNLENDLIEKKLHSVVYKGHILGFGNLFGILKKISENKDFSPYLSSFKDFLEKYFYIGNILLEKDFLEIYKKLVDLETFGSKRHIGKVDFEDVFKTRKYFLGDFKDKNCFLYKLLKILEF
ncbi:hypothetical protein DLH72_00475 [Candidatus Gracilibacteria bacterium]|nr:MAG: hypothetical protein DLH72_00475 [Candidatus Gracilibacteria bacterium]